ncbi:MAG: hypothetical protein LBQ05_02645 [Christensenellaceae bacterium]|jgi:hypothetical protein|nr:hypothetical protein [Christensenellaceae bacterium]
MKELKFKSMDEMVNMVGRLNCDLYKQWRAETNGDFGSPIYKQISMLTFVDDRVYAKGETELVEHCLFPLKNGTERRPENFAKIFKGNTQSEAGQCFHRFVQDICCRPVADEIFDKIIYKKRKNDSLENYVDVKELPPAEGILKERLQFVLWAIENMTPSKDKEREMKWFKDGVSQYKIAARSIYQSLDGMIKTKRMQEEKNGNKEEAANQNAEFEFLM